MNTTPSRSLALACCASLLGCRGDHAAAPRPTPAAHADAAQTDRRPAHADAGTPPAPPPAAEIDLLRLPGVRVTVSSTVRNPRDVPANLIDGDLATAWSSSTGELEGAEVDVDVPRAAHVRAIELTVGMTHTSLAGDLFTMNPRIRRVEVIRDGVSLRSVDLDVEQRGLQTLSIDAAGGVFRVVVTAVVRGARPAWREASISELRVRGTAPAGSVPASAPVIVGVGPLFGRTLPAERYEVAADQPLPVGCFAWSTETETAACTAGAVGHNIGDDYATAEWSLRLLGPRPTEIPLLAGDAGDNQDVMRQALGADGLSRVRAALAAGGFVSVQSVSRSLRSEVTPWGGGAFRWNRTQSHPGGDNQAPTWIESLAVRWDAGAAWTPLDLGDAGPRDSDVRVALVPGDRYALVTVETSLADEGVQGTRVTVFRCDRTLRRCE